MPHAGHARALPRAALLLCLLVAAACRRDDTLPTLRRVPLPPAAARGTTLAVDSAGRAWIGVPGRLVAVDSTGRVAAEVEVGGDDVPRVLWSGGAGLVVAAGDRLLRARADSARAAPGWRSAAMRAVARDPRGRWVYTANGGGGVVGLDAETLAPRWGWPETGAPAVAMTVSPLADRVYVSVDEGEEDGPEVQVRDAASGRVLFRAAQPDALHGLWAAPDGSLYGAAAGGVVRLRHGPRGLRRAWARTPGAHGDGRALEVRVDPRGRRVAAFGRGRGARLVLMEADSGAVVGQTREAPLDAAFGPAGRLYLLEPGVLRVAR